VDTPKVDSVIGTAPKGALEAMLKKPKVKALWDGDISEYEGDESAADMALCMHLAWWLKNDKEAIRAAWLSSPLGQRDKTQERRDYQDRTIDRAIQSTVILPERGAMGHGEAHSDVSTPERDAYREFYAVCNFGDKEDLKKLKALAERYALKFHDYLAALHPHLLYEEGQDKVYWEYDAETGIYVEHTGVTVRAWIHRLLITEGLETHATESFSVNCLARYRGVYPNRGVRYDSFDTVNHWFHVKNGWLNVETGVLEPHTPDRLSRRVSAVSYDPDAKCPLYDKFLDTDLTIANDAVRVIDQFSGLLLTPSVAHQKMLTLIGRPGSGKSTLLDIWSHVLGEFAIQRRLTDLTGDGFRFAGSGLVGRTLCWFDEVDVRKAEMGNVLGTLITGLKINVERKGINNITSAQNTLKCVLTANSLPLSAEHGIYRRLILIPLPRSFYEDGTANVEMINKLKGEASGILNRMLRGYHDLIKMRGFTVISGHDELIEQYKAESNVISEFLDEYFVPTEDAIRIESRLLYESYRAFTGDRIFNTLTPQRFGRMVSTQPLIRFSKIQAVQSHGVRYWTGLRLKDNYKFSENDGFLVKIVDNSSYDFEP
jgi:putative DNA primase/helicase